mgnify:CR=1 FL=1
MADSDNLLETMTSSYANARGFLARANAIYSAVTFKIARGKPEESIADLAKKFRLDASQQQTPVSYTHLRAHETQSATNAVHARRRQGRPHLHR